MNADQGAQADQMPDREHPQTADHPADSAPTDQRTNPAPGHEADQVANHGAPAADQQLAAGPQEADSEGRSSNAAGQAVPDLHGPADHERADHVRGPDEGPGPVSADQGDPADQMPDREHPQTADHQADSAPTDQRTNPAPDHPDHEADQPLDPPADQSEDGSSGGPQGARIADHDAPAADQRTKPADQEDEVPWEAKVEVARKAALEEGRMTRRAIRPHLRNANITVSNEHFRVLQAQLYADPTLAHLPRDTRRAR